MIVSPCKPDQVFWCYGFREGKINPSGEGSMNAIFVAAKREHAIRSFEGWGDPPPHTLFTLSLSELSAFIRQGDAEVSSGKALNARAVEEPLTKPSWFASWFTSPPKTPSWYWVGGTLGDTLVPHWVQATDPVDAVHAVLLENPKLTIGSVMHRTQYVELEDAMERARLGTMAVVHCFESDLDDKEAIAKEDLEYLMKTVEGAEEFCAEDNKRFTRWSATEEGKKALQEWDEEDRLKKTQKKS